MHLWNFTTRPHTENLPREALFYRGTKTAGIKDTKDMHNLGEAFPGEAVDLNSKNLRLMDVWGSHQAEALRKVYINYTYDCWGNPWKHRVTFLGVAADGLMSADAGLKLRETQKVWCFSGSGANRIEDPSSLEQERRWKRETNMHQCDLAAINKQLSKIKIKAA